MRKLNFAAASVIAIAVGSAPAYAQNAPTDAPQAADGGLEEIVVTAQRKSENLQKVPIAITAISATMLKDRGISDAFALGNGVPGLQVTQTGTTTTPYIRGIGSNAANANAEASVATYVDGFYIAAPYANALAFNNVDRIEVLKGPQGTLFGRNATGGVIQVITRTPSQDPSAEMSVGYGNYQTLNASAYLTGGLSNTVSADIAVQYKNQARGFGRDLFRNTDVYKGWDLGLRSKIRWQPSAATDITLGLNYAELKNDSLNYVYPKGSCSPLAPTICYSGRYNTQTDQRAQSHTKAYGTNLTIKQDLGFATLVSLTQRSIAKGYNLFDRDSIPATIVTFNTPQRVRTWTQELQLNSNSASPLSWTLGAFYIHNTAGYVPGRLIGLAFGPLPTSELDIEGIQKTDSVSVYGQATYEIAPQLKLTGGLRYTHENAKIAWRVGPPGALAPAGGNKTSFDKPTWRIAADYEFVPQVHGYVSYNRGIKSGGFDILNPGGQPFRPETLDAYETGLKSQLFDNHLRLNISAFLYKYKDIQVSANPTGGIITINGSRATIKGIDADFELAVTNSFRLSGGAGYTDGQFDDFPNPVVYNAVGVQYQLNAANNAKGYSTTRTPKFTANLLASYTLDTSIGKIVATGSFYHNSGFYWDVDNRLRSPEYNLLGASLKWTDSSDKIDVRLWVENLTDKAYQTQGVSGASFGDTVVYGAPRTYGVTLTGRF